MQNDIETLKKTLAELKEQIRQYEATLPPMKWWERGLYGLHRASPIQNLKQQLHEIKQQVESPVPFDEAYQAAPEAALVKSQAPVAPVSAAVLPYEVIRDTLQQFVEGAAPETKRAMTPLLPFYYGEGELPEGTTAGVPKVRTSQVAAEIGAMVATGLLGRMARAAREQLLSPPGTANISSERIIEAIKRPVASDPTTGVKRHRARAGRKGKVPSDPEAAEKLLKTEVDDALRAEEEAARRISTLADQIEEVGGVTESGLEELTSYLSRGLTPEEVEAIHRLVPGARPPKPRTRKRKKPPVEEELPDWYADFRVYAERNAPGEGSTKAVANPMPPPSVVRQQIWDKLREGASPKRALHEVAEELDRSPEEVLNWLEGLPPAKGHVISTMQTAASAATAHRNLREMVDQLFEKEPWTVDDVPRPFKFAKGAIAPNVPKPVEEAATLIGSGMRSWSDLFRSIFGGSNNPVIDYMTAHLEFVNNVLRYMEWFKELARHHGLRRDIAESLEAVERELTPLFKRYAEHAASRGYRLRKDDKVLQQIYSEADEVLRRLAAAHPNVRLYLAAEGYKWAARLCSPEERKLVKLTRRYLDLKKAQLKEQKVPVIEHGYVPHIFLEGPEATQPLWWPDRADRVPQLLKFMSRDPNSRSWFPLWYQTLTAYVPVVERKLAMNQVLGKWTKAMRTLPKPVASEVGNFLKSVMLPEHRTVADAVLDAVTNGFYFSTIFGNLAVPLLHLFKVLQTPAWHGFGPYTKAMWRLLKVVKPGTPERELIGTYVKLSQLMRVVDQSIERPAFFQPGFWRRLSQRMKTASYLPTAIVEWYDNGVNMLAALERGMKAGASPQLIHREMLDTMLALNFRSFDAPALFRRYGALGRAAFMYQLTPYKLLENKASLLWRALTSKRDAFGGSDFAKLVRLAVVLGVPYMVGKELGYDLSKHVLHPPFLTHSFLTGEKVLVTTPLIQLMQEASREGWEKLPQLAGRKFVLPTKLARIAADRVPEQYGGPMSYIFGIPRAGYLEEAAARHQMQQMRKQLRSPRTPAPSAVDLPDLLEELFK